MQLLLGSYYLNLPVGGVTYFVTVAEHLQQLGHDIAVYTREPGPMAERLENRGIVVLGPHDAPQSCDAILAQDARCAYELAERFPGVPQVFVSHSAELAIDLPPQLPDVVSAVVVLNDRVKRRVEASALDAEVVRLRQPIDFTRFRGHVRLRRPPQRALLLGNYLEEPRLSVVSAPLERAGISWRQLGRPGELTLDPAIELAEADIVVGYGRSILEAMSTGCAAYVCEFNLDGWVTSDSYAAMEADGFAGTAFEGAIEPDRLERDLATYDPAMGVVNRELVIRHHSAFEHADRLASLLGRLAPRRTPAARPAEMARLVRLQWEGFLRVENLRRELTIMHGRTVTAEERALAAERRALEAEGRLGEIKRSRRYRLAQRLAAPLERLRSILWRG